MDSNGHIKIIGLREYRTQLDSSLILATAGHALEFDDSEFIGETHPSTIVFSALHSLIGSSCTFETFFHCAAIGMKALFPIGKAMNPEHYGRGWHATGTVGIYAATIAAASFLKLNPLQMTNALSIAATQAAGIQGVYGKEIKAINAGQAASKGLLSALLASKNINASKEIFEKNSGGVFKVFGANNTWKSVDFSQLPEDLGWITPKEFPSCHCTHSAIYAARDIWKKDLFKEIESISICGSPYAIDMTSLRHPENKEKAFFSTSYCVAATLISGSLNLKSFESDTLSSPQINALESKTTLSTDNSFNKMQTKIIVRLKDNSIISSTKSVLRDSNNVDLSFVEKKFLLLTDGLVKNKSALETSVKDLNLNTNVLSFTSDIELLQQTQ